MLILKTRLKETMSEVNKAYMAGLVDGEGTIGYYYQKRSHGLMRHDPTVMITNTDPRVMDWLMERVGYGTVTTIRSSYHRRKHVVHHWRIGSSVRCQDFLEAIYPYLIIKKDQAKLMLDLWDKEGLRTAGHPINDEIKSYRDKTVTRLKQLKTIHLELADPMPVEELVN